MRLSFPLRKRLLQRSTWEFGIEIPHKSEPVWYQNPWAWGKKTGKIECVFPIVDVSILPYAELGSDNHQEDAPHFSCPLQSDNFAFKCYLCQF